MRTRTGASARRCAGASSQMGSWAPEGEAPSRPRGVLRMAFPSLQMFQLFVQGSAGSWTHACGHVPMDGCGGLPRQACEYGRQAAHMVWEPPSIRWPERMAASRA